MAITFEQLMDTLSRDPWTGEPLVATNPATAKSTFITRRALIAECQKMDLDTVLFSAQRRTPTQHRGYAVEVALSQFIATSFGQKYHAVRGGAAQVENPSWFKQLYTDLMWSSDDITPGAILQALSHP